jgi:pilus assembly protein CpaB
MRSGRRRALALLGLALLLGGLAASDVSRREAAVRDQLAPLVDVVVAGADLEAGRRLRTSDLSVRRMPTRYAPAGAAFEPAELVGRRIGVPVPQGGYLAAGQLDVEAGSAGAAGVRRGERAADVVGTGSAELVRPGARVDVLVTRERGDGGSGATELALEDVEVLAAGPAPGGGGGNPAETGAPQVLATLRVTLRQAVYLAAAQSFARELRLLARAPGDRRRSGSVAFGGDELR